MLRRYNLNDIDSIVKLEEATIGSSLGYDMLASNLNNEMNHYYVYELNNKVVGYISIVFDGYIAEILNFCVDKEYQNNKIGTKVLEQIVDIYNSLNCESLILEVRESNKRAIHVYEKLGFKKISRRRNYYSNNEDALVLQKLLNNGD